MRGTMDYSIGDRVKLKATGVIGIIEILEDQDGYGVTFPNSGGESDLIYCLGSELEEIEK